MNPPRKKAKFLIASVASLSLGFLASQEASATDYTFTGTGEWYASPSNSNWTPTPMPGLTNTTLDVAGNTATINGAVDYNAAQAGGDFYLGNGDSMIIDGGSWTQAATVGNWIRIGDGSATATAVLDIKNGGSFNVASNGVQVRIGIDGEPVNLTVESTAGGFNTAINGNTNTLSVASNSTINILGGMNSLGEISSAGTITFGGGTTTTGQWDNAAATYNVTGGSTTVTSYDMNTAGATFNVTGGSVNFTGNFTNLAAVTVSGGSVSVAGTFNTNSSTNFNMSAGSLNYSGGGRFYLDPAATFKLSGNAVFNLTNTGAEFQPGATAAVGAASVQSISGNAQINVAGLAAFQGGSTQKFDINGGSITIGASGYNGIYSSGGYFNFTTNSTGNIMLTNVSVTGAIADIDGGKVRYDDMQYTTLTYGTEFTVIPEGANGSEIELTGALAAVPEPSTWLGGGLLLGVAGFVKRSRLAAVLGMLRQMAA